jgi:translation elongation factor EF-Tu-like GTPase
MSKIKLALDVVSDLKSLAESIETLVRAMESNETVPANEEPVKKKSKAKAKVEEAEPEVEEAPEEKQPTLEEVRAAMADKSRDGHREAVKAIITKYGANNLSSLDPKHYAAALKEVGELK